MNPNSALNSINPMGWTQSPWLRSDVRRYAYGRKYPICAPVGWLLPSVLFRPSAGAIVQVMMYDENGNSQDITNAASTGIEIVAGNDQDEIIYRGAAPMIGSWTPGVYRFEMTDGRNRWSSDWITWTTDTQRLVKLEYWHDEPLDVPGWGVLSFPQGFRWCVWLNTNLFKPRYQYGQDVREANNVNYPFRKSRWKEYRFALTMPEHVIDAISTAQIHHHVQVTHLDVVYNCTEFRMQDPEWLEEADLAIVSCQFRTGMIATSFAVSLGGSRANEEPCFATTFVVSRFFFDRFGALNPPQGIDVNPRPGYVLYAAFEVENAELYFVPENGEAFLYQYSQGDTFFVPESGNYYIASSIGGGSILQPQILSITGSTLEGLSLPGTIAQIQVRPADGFFSPLPGAYTSSEIEQGVDLTGQLDGIVEARLVLSTAVCGQIFVSAPIAVNAPPEEVLDGIGYDTIATDNEIE